MDCLHRCLDGWQLEVLAIDDPWSTLNDVRCWEYLFADESLDYRVAHIQLSRCLLLRYPTILLLKWRDLMVAAQSGHPRRIPSLLLARLISEAIQNRRDALIGTDLR